MTVEISFAPDEEIKLRERAAAAGMDVQTFVRAAALEKADRPTLSEVLAPIHQGTVRQGITVEQIDDAIDWAREAYGRERKNQNAPGH
jgi:hypothetical protein